jgi:hypothetical protein
MSNVSSNVLYSVPTLLSLVFVGLLIAGALVSACDSGGSNGGEQPVLIPLEVGNSWTYEGIVGGVGNSSGTISISDTRTVNGTEYYEFKSSEVTYFVDKREDGMFVRDNFDPEEFLLRYPVDDGEIYDYTDSGGVTYQVTVSKQSVEVEAGTFDAVKYDINGPDPQVETATFAPGVGLVRFDDGGRNDAELISYNVE